MGASTIKFNGCFHDMPWGLQTHIYAPMNVDLRNKYRIAGNQPGVEPPEIPEIGMKKLGVPSDGLYLKEDIEIKCNVTVLSFVKSQLKKASGEMVSRIIKKAELLDAGALQAMIEDGKLRTINPADRSNRITSPLPSPTALRYSPSVSGSPPLGSPPIPYQVPRIQSSYGQYQRPSTSGSQSSSGAYAVQPPAVQPPAAQELPASEASPPAHPPIEMPGDFYHASPGLQPDRQSPQQQSYRSSPRESLIDPNQPQHPNASPNLSLGGGGQQWTTAPGSRPVSAMSGPPGSPRLADNRGFSPPLASHRETNEEYQEDDAATKTQLPPQYVPYNPADYAKAPPGQPQYGHGQLDQRGPRFSYS
jgi:hypothetical protein